MHCAYKSFITCFFILLFLCSIGLRPQGSLQAQALVKETGIPFIRHYTKKEYKGGTQNWDFTQSENNLLYVANNLGVIIFDGIHWDLLPLPNGSVVRSLFEDSDGKIFAGGFNEFGFLKEDASGFPAFYSLSDAAGNPETGEIWRIARQGDYLHFQSYTHLVSWNTQTDEWSVQQPKVRFGFLQVCDKELYINDEGFGLQRINGTNIASVPGGDFYARKEIWDILRIGDDMLVCTQNQGVFVLDNGQSIPWETPVNDFLLQNRFFCSERSGEYLFWGSILDGMVISNRQGEIIKHLNRDIGLSNNTVLSLFTDREGSLWMGLDKGIAQIHINVPLSVLKTTEDIGAGYAAALFEDKIYLGTNQGLFWVENFVNQKPGKELLTIHPVSSLAGQVWSLQVFGDELLVGHNLGAFAVQSGKTRQIGSTPGGWVFVKVPERQGIIAGGSYYGLEIYEKRNGLIEPLNQVSGFSESFRHFLFENERILWMGHGYEGIYRLELNDSLTQALDVTRFDASSGLGMKSFNELLMVTPEVVVCNPSGYFVFDPASGDFVPSDRWNMTFGASGRMTRLIQQNEEKYWFFQENTAGMVRIINDTLLVKDEKILAPLTDAFIPSFENISFLGEQDFLIGTDDGFVHLNPELMDSFSENYPVLFRSVTSLRNDSLRPLPILKQNNEMMEMPDFPYRFNDLRVQFVAPNLTIPEQTEYRYWLEGQSLDWTSWTNNNFAEFINLREGDYVLHVQSRNVFGIPATEGALALTIKTPWYRSGIAYVSYLLAIIGTVALAWYLIQSNLEREKRKTKILEKRKMLHKQLQLKRDSEKAEKEIVKLRNDKLRADIRHKSKELANQTMGIIQKNKFLTDIKEEMVRLKSQAQNDEVKSSMKRMIRKIDRNIEDEDALRIFETNFDQVHENFLRRLREAYPQLTAKDLRLCAYLRLNLSSKEIAPMLNISIRGVEISRYRLRKKLNLDHKEHLADFILRF